ncbi:hypothetical protein L1049_025733 [Liquidambar formosana]|uniref:VQ domain-containing protein n=1 Tax=Liquidambar formosana TaxID=63359 RepID=A0AAP0NDG5_LIQFO
MPRAPPSSISFTSDLSWLDNSSFSMDSTDFPDGKSPRRELQGPRPAPLKVRKDSYKIKKPPVPPHQQPSQPPLQHRPPVIIYTVSPKVIHTKPSEFMTLVQRLTGSSSSSTRSSSSSSYPLADNNTGAISPAARFATIEKARSPPGKKKEPSRDGGGGGGVVEGIEMGDGIERTAGFFPGILSPGPASLQPIPPNFFSPPSDPNTMGFFHDLSPVLHGHKNYMEGSFMPSPSNFFSPHIPSPTPYLDIFNNFFDL